MKTQPQRGYHVVDPGLALPRVALSPDEQVRCLAYLMSRMREIVSVPEGVLYELIPDEYFGGPYPAIGLYTDTFIDTSENLSFLSLVIGEQIEAFIKQIGVDHLLELSAGETVCWQDVLKPYEDAWRRRQDDQRTS
jgi:hypothetical protein